MRAVRRGIGPSRDFLDDAESPKLLAEKRKFPEIVLFISLGRTFACVMRGGLLALTDGSIQRGPLASVPTLGCRSCSNDTSHALHGACTLPLRGWCCHELRGTTQANRRWLQDLVALGRDLLVCGSRVAPVNAEGSGQLRRLRQGGRKSLPSATSHGASSKPAAAWIFAAALVV